MEYGNVFRLIRERAGATQNDVADHCGCSRSYVSHVEHGRRRASERYCEMFASRFDADSDILKLRSGHMPSNLTNLLRNATDVQLRMAILCMVGKAKVVEASGSLLASAEDYA